MKFLNVVADPDESVIFSGYTDIVNSFGFENFTNNNGLPTIIIGWGNVKKLYPDKVSFFDNKVKSEEYVHWLFSTKEKGLNSIPLFKELFIKLLNEWLASKVTYKFIDLFIDDIDITDFINKTTILVSYIHKERIIYFLSDNKVIYGIDLDSLRFLGINKNEIKKMITEKSKQSIDVFNFKYSEYFVDRDRYIPYLYSIFNENFVGFSNNMSYLYNK